MKELRSPADRSGKRLNAALGAYTSQEKARIELEGKPPDRSVPVDLDGAAFRHRCGAGPDDDSEDPLLRQARLAYHAMGDCLSDMHARERAILANLSATVPGRILAVDRMARTRHDAPAKNLDAVRRQLQDAIKAIDGKIESSFRAQISPEIAGEIRGFVLGLSDSKRRDFLAKEADSDTLAAILSGKPFLSGLKPAEAAQLRLSAVQKNFPGDLIRREKFSKAVELIDAGWSLYIQQAAKLFHAEADKIAQAAEAAARAES
jgi:hypothetical protein